MYSRMQIATIALLVCGSGLLLASDSRQGNRIYGNIRGQNTDWLADAQKITEKIVHSIPSDDHRMFQSFFRHFSQYGKDTTFGTPGKKLTIHLQKRSRDGNPAEEFETECQLDRRGNFMFDELSPGLYTLSFAVEQPGIISSAPRNNIYSYDVSLDFNSSTEFPIVCSDLFVTVKGKVVDPNGKPVGGAQVRAVTRFPFPTYTGAESSWSTYSDAEGNYELQNLPAIPPPAWALYLRSYGLIPPHYAIIATAPEFSFGHSQYFFPVTEEVRIVADKIAESLPQGKTKHDYVAAQSFFLPENNMTLECPVIQLQPKVEGSDIEIEQWLTRRIR